MHTIALSYSSYLSRIMAMLGLIIAVSAFAYAFFLLEAVGHTASRSAAEREIKSLGSELASLESRYLSQTKDVTATLAAQMGFVAPTDTYVVFAQRSTLSLNQLPATGE